MSRNDSLLYSGATSASFARRRERNQEKIEKQIKFVKNAKYVFEEIDKEKAMLGEVLNAMVDGNDHEEEVLMKLLAVRLHRKWLFDLEKRLKIVLKAQPLAVKESSDEK